MRDLFYSFGITVYGIVCGIGLVYLFVQFIAWISGMNDETEMLRQDHEISAVCDDLRFRRIRLLQSLGRPRANGRWDAQQLIVWDCIHDLDRREKEFLAGTEVVNIEPLGHNIGRVYKVQR